MIAKVHSSRIEDTKYRHALSGLLLALLWLHNGSNRFVDCASRMEAHPHHRPRGRDRQSDHSLTFSWSESWGGGHGRLLKAFSCTRNCPTNAHIHPSRIQPSKWSWMHIVSHLDIYRTTYWRCVWEDKEKKDEWIYASAFRCSLQDSEDNFNIETLVHEGCAPIFASLLNRPSLRHLITKHKDRMVWTLFPDLNEVKEGSVMKTSDHWVSFLNESQTVYASLLVCKVTGRSMLIILYY